MSSHNPWPDFWIPQPELHLTKKQLQHFETLEETFVASASGASIPFQTTQPQEKWAFLHWLSQRQPVLFHGSTHGNIECFEPRAPFDRSADDFSKQTAVYASSDALWAMFYAVLDRSIPVRFLNGALQFQQEDGWSRMHYFFSVDSLDEVAATRNPWHSGTVYILPAKGFEQQPPYTLQSHTVLEPHWASLAPVKPLAHITIEPEDFPLLHLVRTHQSEVIDQWAKLEPDGFPWLDSQGNAQTLPIHPSKN
ncbi:hypothetical protein [Deinococcus misasensis]|uniref:hypothetical protein n=1 Tax=Deinococcus misasensis TaxID=392413 RepID=UPI000689553C|nr:hypothetical protein [Deinococcus misasensis]